MRWRDIRTALAVVTEPAIEPVSRAEAKWHARIDVNDEDVLIDGYIHAARRQVEKDTGRALVNTVYDFTIDAFPEERAIRLPRWPVASVTSITSYDDDDVVSTFAASKYFVDTAQRRIRLNDGETWPTDRRDHAAGVIRFSAGAAEAAVTVSTLTSTGSAPDVLATATTSAAHGYTTNDRVTIAGALEDSYNGTFAVRVTSTTSFTYRVVSGAPATTATGTLTARRLFLPSSYWLAVLMLTAHYYEQRTILGESTRRAGFEELPLGYAALIGGADREYAIA